MSVDGNNLVIKRLFAYAEAHKTHFLDELKSFLRIPSISTQMQHAGDIHLAADWLKTHLQQIGFPVVKVIETPGHPIVFADWSLDDNTKPTILIYGHYDVQPPDPLAEWKTPPFDPTIDGDELYARGASDDKGQLFIHLKAVDIFNSVLGEPPVNVKLLIEGEEESGSVNLEPFIQQHQSLLAADYAVISDTHILGRALPSIVYALRGLTYIEVEVTGPEVDLHSGTYGGAVNNPINALCRMIAGMQDANGTITIPHFYDSVRALTPAERRSMAEIPFDKGSWLAETGSPLDWGETDFSIIERMTARPTLDVNGIWGGYTDPGAKTVLPSKAFAKISMRLVPDQESGKILALVRSYFKDAAPPSVRVEVRDLHGGEAAIVDLGSPAIRVAAEAYNAVFGVEPLFVREGGSIPVVNTLKRQLGIDTVLMGFGLPDDRLHSPNEKIYLPNLFRGIDTMIHFLLGIAEI